MANRDPRQPGENFDPAAQTDESKGKIKRPQDNAQKNLPRGSEPETHARK